MPPKGNQRIVIAGTPDKPLLVGGQKLSCYVLKDETRVIGRQDLIRALSLTTGGHASPENSDGEMPDFVRQKWLQPFVSAGLKAMAKSPILYTIPTGQTAHGYPADMLIDLCKAIIDAHHAGSTTSRQEKIVRQATVIVSAFAKTGITAVIDEVTGYDAVRIKTLQEVLESYLAREMQVYDSIFPLEFYEQICRLWDWPEEYKFNRPPVVGKFTNEEVYERLIPDLRPILDTLNPMRDDGTREHYHHQFLTSEVGRPKLQAHLYGLIGLMKASSNWGQFQVMVRTAYPKSNEQLPLPMIDDIINDRKSRLN